MQKETGRCGWIAGVRRFLSEWMGRSNVVIGLARRLLPSLYRLRVIPNKLYSPLLHLLSLFPIPTEEDPLYNRSIKSKHFSAMHIPILTAMAENVSQFL